MMNPDAALQRPSAFARTLSAIRAAVLRVPFALWVPILMWLAVAASLHGFGFPPSWRTEKAVAVLAVPPTIATWAVVASQVVLARRAARATRFLAVALAGPLLALPLGGLVFSVQHVATYPLPFHFSLSEEGVYVLGWSGATALYLYLSVLRLYLPWTPLAFLALAAIWSAGRRR